jgi:hypothetical protein
METVTTWSRPFPKTGNRKWFPNPPCSKQTMTLRKAYPVIVRLRTRSNRKTRWTKAANKRGQTLSEFMRDATDAATVGLVDNDALLDLLCDIRSSINASMHLRTADQQRDRLQRAVDKINNAIRKGL